jgi:hypothetical protein
MMKHNKPEIALCMLVQSVAFLIVALLTMSKKKSFSHVILIFSAIGAGCAAFLLWRQTLEDKMTARRRQSAMDSFCDISGFEDADFDDAYDFDVPDLEEVEISENDIYF